MKTNPNTVARRPRHRDVRDLCLDAELCAYRNRTRSLLLRYLRLSIDTGRLPSVLGREFFRAKSWWRRPVTFEDAVIFVHDMESALQQLDTFSQRVLTGIIFEDYSVRELARVLRTKRRTILENYLLSLDQLSELLLLRGTLRPIACQEAKKPPSSVKSLNQRGI